MSRRRPRPAAFTIVEATLSVVIVGVLLVASTRCFSVVARGRASQVEARQACLLGQQVMAEVAQCSFQQQATSPTFGPSAGLTRPAFTYVDAYDGYAASPPVNRDGSAMPAYARWTEAVAVAFVNPSNPTAVVASSTLKQVTVTVTAPSGKAYMLTGLRSKFGAYELVPSVQTNYVTGVAVTVQGGSASVPMSTGAHPLNITTSQ